MRSSAEAPEGADGPAAVVPGAQRTLAGAALIMMAAFVSSRLTGLARDIAVTYQFGTGREMDAYLAAIRVPDLVFQVFAGGAVASAFIPVFARYATVGDRDGAWRMVSTLLNLSAVVLVPVIALLIALAEPLMALLGAGFDEPTRSLAAGLARLLMISPLFFTLGCFVTSVLNASQRFVLAALAPASYNLGIMAGALVLAPTLGIRGLAMGAVVGSLLFLLVQIPGLPGVGMKYRLVLDLTSPGVRQVGRLMVPRAFGLAVSQAGAVAVVVLASPVPGAIAALNYSQLLMMLPLGVFAMAIAQAVFPRMALEDSLANSERVREILDRALGLVLFLTIPSAVALVTVGELVVRVLWERGQFGAASTAMTVQALRLYAPGLIALATTEIVTRVFYARRDTRTPVIASTVAMVANITLAYLLSRTISFGGIAIAATIAAFLEALLVVAFLYARIGGFGRGALRSARQSIGASALMAAVIIGADFAIPVSFISASGGLLQHLARLVALGAIGAAVYLPVAAAMRAREIATMTAYARIAIGRLRRF